MPGTKHTVHYKKRRGGTIYGVEPKLYIASWHKSEAFELANSGNIGVFKDEGVAAAKTAAFIRERLKIENKLFDEFGEGVERAIVDLQLDLVQHGYAACYLEDPMSTSFVFEIQLAYDVDID